MGEAVSASAVEQSGAEFSSSFVYSPFGGGDPQRLAAGGHIGPKAGQLRVQALPAQRESWGTHEALDASRNPHRKIEGKAAQRERLRLIDLQVGGRDRAVGISGGLLHT